MEWRAIYTSVKKDRETHYLTGSSLFWGVASDISHGNGKNCF